MAKLEVKGFEMTEQTLQELGTLPEEDRYSMLERGGDILISAMKRRLASLGLVKTGRLMESITAARKLTGSLGQHLLVYPRGKHHGKTTANEVGFILEYGKPANGVTSRGKSRKGIPAYHWMKESVEESEDEVVDALQAGLDELIKEKGL